LAAFSIPSQAFIPYPESILFRNKKEELLRKKVLLSEFFFLFFCSKTITVSEF